MSVNHHDRWYNWFLITMLKYSVICIALATLHIAALSHSTSGFWGFTAA